MKYVNFVDQKIEERTKKFNTWLMISLIILGMTCVILITLQIRAFTLLKKVAQEHELINNQHAQQQEMGEQRKNLELQEQDLKNKLNTLNTLKQQNSTIIERVTALQALNSKNCTLVSSSLHANKVTMTLEFPTLEIAHHSIATLAQNAIFKELTIQSITKNKNKTLQIICKTDDV